MIDMLVPVPEEEKRVEALMEQIALLTQNCKQGEKSPHEAVYRNYFNALDLSNKLWYSSQRAHEPHCWTLRALLHDLQWCFTDSFAVKKQIQN
jgi:hypothetical protein